MQQNAINRKLKDALERIFQNKFSHTQARDWKPVFERDMAKFVLHLIVVHLDDSATLNRLIATCAANLDTLSALDCVPAMRHLEILHEGVT